jgi:hypothetical protein
LHDNLRNGNVGAVDDEEQKGNLRGVGVFGGRTPSTTYRIAEKVLFHPRVRPGDAVPDTAVHARSRLMT